MEPQIKIKPQYANTVIGFNHSGAPLGLRNDLHLLYETALASNQVEMLEMFEVIPTTEQIEEIKVAEFVSKQEDKLKLRSERQNESKRKNNNRWQ